MMSNFTIYCLHCRNKLRPFKIKNDWSGRRYHAICFAKVQLLYNAQFPQVHPELLDQNLYEQLGSENEE